MNKGRATCEVLKGIRLQIARENCIDYQIDECIFEGNCSGTCPKCEADIRFLERELVKQNKLGKAVVIAGLSVGLLGGLTGCGNYKQDNNIVQKELTPFDSTLNETVLQDTLITDSIIEISKQKFPPIEIDGMVGIVDVCPEDLPDVYRFVDTMPQFPGGMKKLEEFIKSETKYPENAKNLGISGTVLIQFIVEPDSTLSNILVLIPFYPELDEEAIRVINASPKWIPGKKDGEPVRVYYQIPIRFSLQ